ncbi:gliding motility-associated ABC transporter substrate-binding protein GldG [Pedobacter insulae]|uniref:Gliding-associated putative ABC transporter substrate-binding component GldG n=1 Tax=Pedobacter insulae TaxID=414048 RepID=A0A1I2VP89_9SPHI|nr:gliding motility-associated ABC transporter substrate-binding protein GldG [Pedobacter insulae]SFG91124.1 gliding-associated putative ABC transporter substrate-binding component GldG [Pedobacter insulae]
MVGRKGKAHGTQRIKHLKTLAFIVVLTLINVFANYFYTRFDFTKEKRYTLTERTKEILKQTKKDITITVFLAGEMPSAFKRLQNATKDLLVDYKSYANASVKLIYIDPISGLSVGEQENVLTDLDEIGIKPVAVNIKSDAGLSQKIIFPMALVEIDGKPMPVSLLQKSGGPATNYEENITNSIQNLEYTFSSAIQTLLSGQNPRIGFTEGNGEPTNLQLYDAITSLSQRFYVGRVDLKLINKEGLDSLKLLFVGNPKVALTETEKYKLNYFVMKGGRLVWIIDQVRANLDDLQTGTPRLATNSQLNIDDMLFEYGVRINYNLIADLNSALIPVSSGPLGQGQIQLVPWQYYPVLMPDSSHNVVKNIDGIRTEFASSLDTIGVPGINKKIILTTSPYHQIYTTPKMLSLQLLSEQPDPKEFQNRPKPAGVLLEGTFKSVFLNRPIPEGIKEVYDVPARSKPTKMIVIGDGDVFTNQVSKSDNMPFPLGFDRYSQQNYGNKALLLNIADYFTDDHHLIALRNKEIKVRLLDKMKLKVDKTKWQAINAAFPILLLILFATFQHYYRKRKYTK